MARAFTAHGSYVGEGSALPFGVRCLSRHPNLPIFAYIANTATYAPPAVISHGLTKEKKVPEGEIEVAIRHRKLFEMDPAQHTYEEPENEQT